MRDTTAAGSVGQEIDPDEDGTAGETLLPETAGTEEDAAAESGEMTEETNDPSDEAGSEPEPQEP